MNSFPIGIVLYNPTVSSINRILFFANCGTRLYIFDNSSVYNDQLSDVNNINYFFLNKNFGLSFSIDFLCKNAIADKFKYLLFFDQDTIFSNETLNYIEEFIIQIEDSKNPFFDSIISFNFRDKSIEHNKLNVISKNVFNNYEFINIYFSINSGSLFMLNKYSFFTWFDNRYFVDGVDYSFSLNVLLHKFKNLSISNIPGLNHSDEQGDTTVIIFGKRLTSRVYPLSRNIDFLKSHMLLFRKSFNIKPIKPKLFLIKAILSYIIVQLIFRLRNLFK